MIEIDFDGLRGKQVNRNRIAAKGVEHQNVKVLELALVALAIQRQPRIAQHDIALSTSLARISKIRKPLAGSADFDHRRVDVIKANRVTTIDVGGHLPTPQA